jgi:hypothetical protein
MTVLETPPTEKFDRDAAIGRSFFRIRELVDSGASAAVLALAAKQDLELLLPAREHEVIGQHNRELDQHLRQRKPTGDTPPEVDPYLAVRVMHVETLKDLAATA